jgi:hypothetical protein
MQNEKLIIQKINQLTIRQELIGKLISDIYEVIFNEE